FGGMNVLGPTSALAVDEAEHLPLSAGWRDVHVRLSGPAVAQAAESFERSWRRARRDVVPRRDRAYRQAVLPAGTEAAPLLGGRRRWRCGCSPAGRGRGTRGRRGCSCA